MPPKRKAAKGYKLPDPLPEGLVITALNKKQFRLGKSIGVGGFGEIYLASENVSKAVTLANAEYVLKIEPHENGPLFVEVNFYIRAAQPDVVDEFRKARKLGPNFGMPCLRGSGSHVHKGEKYRFLVMDRFGTDLQKIFQTGKNCFSDRVTYNLAIKIIDVLEYIHSKGYAHNDVKAQNLLMGHGKGKEEAVFLVDFGLVTKYIRDDKHNEHKLDPRKAHDGTIEYNSRDAHIGAFARRSDLEVLAFNLVHWMSGTLPWMNCLTDPKKVQAAKESHMKDPKGFLKACFKSNDYPDVLLKFLTYVIKLKFEAEPDYNACRKMFKDALAKKKYPMDGKIIFDEPQQTAGRKRSSSPRKKATPAKAAAANGRSKRTPSASPKKKTTSVKRPAKVMDSDSDPEDFFEASPPSPKKKAAAVKSKTKAKVIMKDTGSQTSPAFVKAAKAAAKSKAAKLAKLATNPEIEGFAEKAKASAKKATTSRARTGTPKKTNSTPETNGHSNPTPAMLALLKKRAENESAKKSSRKVKAK